MRLIPFGTPSRTNKYVFPAGRPQALPALDRRGRRAARHPVRGVHRERPDGRLPGRLSSPHAPVRSGAHDLSRAGRDGSALPVLPRSVRDEPLRTPGTFGSAPRIFSSSRRPRTSSARCPPTTTDSTSRCGAWTTQCSSCRFRSMANHPEIAVVKLGKMPTRGPLPTGGTSAGPEEGRNSPLPRPTGRTEGLRTHHTEPLPALPHERPGRGRRTRSRRRRRLPRTSTRRGRGDRRGPRGEQARRRRALGGPPNMTHRDLEVLYNLWKLSRELDPGRARPEAGDDRPAHRRPPSSCDSLRRRASPPPCCGSRSRACSRRRSRSVGSRPGRRAPPRAEGAGARPRADRARTPARHDGAPADGSARAPESASTTRRPTSPISTTTLRAPRRSSPTPSGRRA